MSALPRPAGEHPERPRGLALGTTLAGLTGLAVVWAGGFGCVDAVRDHLREDFAPGQPAVQFLLSSGVIVLGLLFLVVSYGLDRGRWWARHLILAGWLAALLLLAFGWGRPDAFQQRALLWTAGFTLFATAYFYVKPNVVAYYRGFSTSP